MPDWKRFWRTSVARRGRQPCPGAGTRAEAPAEATPAPQGDAAPEAKAEAVPGVPEAQPAPAPARSSSRRRCAPCARSCAALEASLAGERATRARLEDEIRALADQDPLTGLASARRFADRLTVAIVHARRHRQKLAVVQLGLDKFASVNERLGRSHGDDLLRSVAIALESTLRQGDTLARGTGDVFTVLLPGIKRDEDVTVIADKLRLALRSPFSLGGHDLLVTASLGMALFPDDGPDPESLLQSATVSMKRAKQKGGDSWDVHAPRSRALAAERQATETQLRRALVQGELELYWQPVVECETGTIVSVESLLRWRRERGVEKAADFVSLADIAGLAVPLGQWTLRAACLQGRKWHDAGHVGLAVSVNISQRQLQHAALVKLVRRVLDETGLPPACLELEVRESELDAQPGPRDRAAQRAAQARPAHRTRRLRHRRQPLAHLYRYPLDSIKIDGSVVSGAPANHDHEAVISAAIALARSRRLKVVAEGVETEAQRVHLVRWQCDRMQGNLCGPPATAAETERLLLRQRQATRELAAARRRAGAAPALVLVHGRGARVSGEDERGWYLEHVAEGGTLRRVRIGALPFRVGRSHGLELVLPAESVSKLHAEIYARGQDLRLRDLGSRNGSFVNRALVEDATLVEGDIVHFADFEFRVGRSDVGRASKRRRAAAHHRGAQPARAAAPLRRGHARAARAAARGSGDDGVPADRAALARDGGGLRGARPRPPPAAAREPARAAAHRREHRPRGGALPAVQAAGGRAHRRASRPADRVPEHAPRRAAAAGAARVARGAARGRPAARPRARDPRERADAPGHRSRSCGRCCSSATSRSPTTTSARARRGCSSSRKRRRTT